MRRFAVLPLLGPLALATAVDRGGPRSFVEQSARVLERGGEAFDAWVRGQIAVAEAAVRTRPLPLAAVRGELRHAIGIGRLERRSPPLASWTGRIDRDAFTVEKVVLEPREGWKIPAHFYLPKGRGPSPAVVVPVGHGTVEGKMHETVQALCQVFARRGIAAITYDPVDQGERRDSGMAHRLGLLLIPAGLTDLAVLVGDTLAAVDFLSSHPSIDASRLAITGCSGGGMNALYAALLDERLRACAPSCYVTTYADLLSSGNHCEDNYLPFVASRLDLGDALAAIAPRPTLVLAATRDVNRLEATEAAVARAKERSGTPEAIALFADESDPVYSRAMRERAYGFFDRALLGRGDGAAVPEPAVAIAKHDDPAWRVFPEGQHPSDAKRLLDLAREAIVARCDDLDRRRREEGVEPGIPRRLAAALALPASSEPSVEEIEPARILDREARRFALRFADGAPGSAVLWPASSEGGPLVVFVHDAGRVPLLLEREPLLRSILEGGATLALLDPRGVGDAAGDVERAWRVSLMVGPTIAGAQTRDLLSAAKALAREAPAPGDLWFAGAGPHASFLALSAAALSSPPARAAVEGLPRSFRDLASGATPAIVPALAVPRLLDFADLPDLRAAARAIPLAELAPRLAPTRVPERR